MLLVNCYRSRPRVFLMGEGSAMMPSHSEL
jgi:hypothetical protein